MRANSIFDEIHAFVDEYQGDLFLFNERFPGGFTPRFGADIRDLSLVAGVRGERPGGLKWDASLSGARSNASLGPDTPTSFRPRDYIQTEVAANLDFSYAVEVAALASPGGRNGARRPSSPWPGTNPPTWRPGSTCDRR